MGQKISKNVAPADEQIVPVIAGIAIGALGTLAAAKLKCVLSKSAQTAKKTKRPEEEGQGLKEYSVVYTDRALNLMSTTFQQVMRDISVTLKEAYNADEVAVIPGSGTYAMEAVAREFGLDKNCLVLRNGYFSFRWTDIFEVCKIPSSEKVLLARKVDDNDKPAYAPPPLEEVLDVIEHDHPDVVFAPHVETATGIIIGDDYIRAVAAAVHSYGGLFVLDSIASGTIWVDMKDVGVDVLISAPQKGWSGPACCGLVMLSARAKQEMEQTESNGFACNLKKWLEVMHAYEQGGFKYYTTLPTDALRQFRDAMLETKAYGFEKSAKDLAELGSKVRALLEKKGFPSVAAPNCKAPGVVVSYADDNTMYGHFKSKGLQVAGGVPFKLGEQAGLNTFRIGLFGLDKIGDIDETVAILERALGV